MVIHLNHGDFKTAVDWLATHFSLVRSPEPTVPTTPSALRLPVPDPGQLARVCTYLVRQRGLAPALLEPLLQSGTLYADARANAVFLLRDPNGVPVGAELRGTTERPWRGLAPGSQKDRGYFALPSEGQTSVVLCESAIDAISCFALHPQYRCLSTAGARAHPPWLQRLLDHGGQLLCGFDADPTGDDMAAAMIALHPCIQRLRPTHHDWNDELRARL